MTRIKCKAGDKVILYRKDECYPNLKVGEDIFTIVEGDLPFPIGRIAGDKSKYPQNYCLKPTSIRHLRKTDKGAKVVIVEPPEYIFFHGFDIGQIVEITGVRSEWGEIKIYEALDSDGKDQWLSSDHFKLAKEQ